MAIKKTRAKAKKKHPLLSVFTTILLIVLVLLLLGALPVWPYSRRWGYGPGGLLGFLLLLLLILWLAGIV